MGVPRIRSGRAGTPLDWLRLWFLLRDPVGRREYALTGFGLMAFKYVAEFLVVRQLTGHVYTLLDFVNPLISAREKFADGAPEWFGLAWVVWALPFLWIAVGMSVRRALDAGISPWHGLWVLVPFVNLIAMLDAGLPAQRGGAGHDVERGKPCGSSHAGRRTWRATVKSAIGGIAVGALYASVRDAGHRLLVQQLWCGRFLRHALRHRHRGRIFAQLACKPVLWSVDRRGGRGAVLWRRGDCFCLPLKELSASAWRRRIVLPLAVAGAPIGKFLADRRRRLHGGLVGAVLFLPVFAVMESQLPNRA